MSAKLDRMLERAVEQIASRQPDFLMDIIVTIRGQDDADAVVKTLEEVGGKSVRVGPGTVSGRVPAGQVRSLAESDHVSGVRLARLHTMHQG